MQLASMKLSPLAFLLAILCFALPFVTVSCQGQNVAKLSGLQLATGATVHQPGPFGTVQDKKIDPVPFAYFALLCAVAGGVLGVVKARKGPLVGTVLALIAAASLLLMKAMYDQEITQQGFGLVIVTYGPGFYLALLFLALAAVVSFFQYRQLKERPPGGLPSQSPLSPANRPERP